MPEDWPACEPVSFDYPSYRTQFDALRFLAFAGWTLLSLGMWAGIIEGVRVLFR